ncbi:MAG: hypothetical protein QMD05_02055 [Candidatus Brocadiaceae bacterium]|nr:hypothetical protein [Candidatus Brocadiaceae bacterium]
MSLAILAVFLLVPCMAFGYEEPMECAFMTVSPGAVSLDTGITDEVYVTILDNEKKPMYGHLITVTNEHPEFVIVEPKEAITDADGKVAFRLTTLVCHDETWCPINVLFACKDREASLYLD